MDLNQLLYHHQMALMAVSRARRDGRLLPDFDLPRYYARQINEYCDQRDLDDAFADRTHGASAKPRADPPTSEPVAGYADFIGDTLHHDPARSGSEDGVAPGHVEQFDVGSSPYFNIHDARAALLRQRIDARGSEGQAHDA